MKHVAHRSLYVVVVVAFSAEIPRREGYRDAEEGAWRRWEQWVTWALQKSPKPEREGFRRQTDESRIIRAPHEKLKGSRQSKNITLPRPTLALRRGRRSPSFKSLWPGVSTSHTSKE